MSNTLLRLDSITDVDPAHAGSVAISGSHGGLYPAAVASQAGLRAVLFNDAGIGLERAGVAGVMSLDGVGMAAAAVDCMTAFIGSSDDMLAFGVISVVNQTAFRLGVEPGMEVAKAVERLKTAPVPKGPLAPVAEARRSLRLPPDGPEVLLLDSASLVQPEDAGKIIVTGSHGGLVGGAPARALKAAARVAVFNDAGGGKDDIGYGRLPALDKRGIAAVTVGHNSARIGDASSALETGVITRCNTTAAELGAAPGGSLRAWLEALGRAAS